MRLVSWHSVCFALNALPSRLSEGSPGVRETSGSISAHSVVLRTVWRVTLVLSEQVCCVEFDRKDINMNKLVATSLEGKFHVFDLRTQHPTKGFASVSEKVGDRASEGSEDTWGRTPEPSCR